MFCRRERERGRERVRKVFARAYIECMNFGSLFVGNECIIKLAFACENVVCQWMCMCVCVCDQLQCYRCVELQINRHEVMQTQFTHDKLV